MNGRKNAGKLHCRSLSRQHQGRGDDRISQEEYLKYLLEQYQNLIYSICLKSVGNPFDAEDLTQEVFLSAYKNLSRFDGTYEKSMAEQNRCTQVSGFSEGSRAAQYSHRRYLFFSDTGHILYSGGPISENRF